MERVQVLIDRLAEQKMRNESAAQLLVTVQLLQQELVLQQQQQTSTSASKKIAVVMPAPAFQVPQEQAPAPEPVPQLIEVKKEMQPVPEVPKSLEPVNETSTPVQPYMLRRPSITELLQEQSVLKEAAPPVVMQTAQPPVAQPHFDILEETPTLLQHTPQEEKKIHKEINQIIHGQQSSLNDQLKQQKTEVAHLLQETPIKDLRKAIGINDKFLFISELFNGDEAMYERSVKTINNFHVLPEAEYWINRELKVRLGWNDTKDSVQHFYQLVRRRFS